MTPELRIVLIAVSILVLMYVVSKIRKSTLNIPDSIFWIVFAILLLILSIFPQIAYFFAAILGMESPFNFLLLLFIAIILLKMFLMTIHQSKLKEQIKTLAQKVAFDEFQRNEENKND